MASSDVGIDMLSGFLLLLGLVFVVLPMIGFLGWVIYQFVKFWVEEHLRHGEKGNDR